MKQTRCIERLVWKKVQTRMKNMEKQKERHDKTDELFCDALIDVQIFCKKMCEMGRMGQMKGKNGRMDGCRKCEM